MWGKINDKLDGNERSFINKLKIELFHYAECFYDNSIALEGSYSKDQIRKCATDFRDWNSSWPILEGAGEE